jgi:oligoribonuclease
VVWAWHNAAMVGIVRKTQNDNFMSAEKSKRLIWIDLEMTGLDTDQDTILEIATIITDSEMEVLAEGPVCAVRQSNETLKAMDDWNRSHHTDSGLWQRVVNSQFDMRQAEQATIHFLEQRVDKGISPMCGNSVCQDRRFMHRLMPDLQSWFHYRNLDVSTLKVLANHWMPPATAFYHKANRHEALSDIRESIEELRYYRKFMGEFGGQSI